jgi:hypothetical protein
LQAELPSAWKGIVREEPSRFVGSDAVILYARSRSVLANSPAITTEQEEFIQVLTMEGKRFGDFDISFHAPYEEINFLDCEVLSPDGKLTRLDPDAIRETQQESPGDYQAGRRKMFSLPGVVPGAILHVRHRTEWQKFPLPHTSMEIPISRDLPAKRVEVEVSVPLDAKFHFAFENIMAADPLIQRGNYGSTYSWKFENVSAPVHEPLSAPRRHGRLLISTFPDWADFAGWYGRICKLTGEITPELAAKAEEVTRECKDDREKVVALYNYVTRLRYIAVPLGVNSFRPHAAVNVFQNQFGDCKDKANLFNTLLRSLKIEAHLVLLPRFGQAHEDLPGLAFNHAISQVFLDNAPLWVDTTDDVCRFGLLPPGDPGRKVLVIDGKTTALVQLPAPAARDHALRIKGTVDCSKPAEHLPLQLQATATGYPDYQLRSVAQQMNDHLNSAPLLEKVARPVTGVFALETQSSTPVSALEEDFSCNIHGRWVGGGEVKGGESVVRAPFWIPNEWNLALHRRKTPLYLNQGYPLTINEEFEVTLPPETRAALLPAPSESKTGPLRWQLEWKRIADNKLAGQMDVKLPSAELSLDETTQFQKQMMELLTALSASARFSSAPAK